MTTLAAERQQKRRVERALARVCRCKRVTRRGDVRSIYAHDMGCPMSDWLGRYWAGKWRAMQAMACGAALAAVLAALRADDRA